MGWRSRTAILSVKPKNKPAISMASSITETEKMAKRTAERQIAEKSIIEFAAFVR